MSITARHIHVSGRVQGVAFRWTTQRRAEQLGLVGWVRNLSDGRVESWIQGSPDAVDEMLAWLATGPPPARVDDRDVRSVDVEDSLEGFSIRSIG
jgi:acylphosphatase